MTHTKQKITGENMSVSFIFSYFKSSEHFYEILCEHYATKFALNLQILSFHSW
jgi:hypothetical protein